MFILIIILSLTNLSSIKSNASLLLVTTAAPATSCPLEFASLGAHKRLGVRVRHTRSQSEVLDGLAGVATTLDQDSLASGRRLKGELVEGYNLAAGLQDPAAGLLCHAECAHLK